MPEAAYSLVIFFAATVAGGIASVAGFGIGSILTPLLALSVGMKQAVPLVAIPHFVATLARFWVLRAHTDRGVLAGFGLMNAAGALLGAWLHSRGSDESLTILLAALLLFAGIVSLLGYADRFRLRKSAAWIAGAVSGAFGGLVGNQGGIRSAAMLGLGVNREAFVATATAIALMVDAVRLPVYLARGAVKFSGNGTLLSLATAGVLAGTLLGARWLHRIPEKGFRRVVGAVLCLIAILLVVHGITS